MFARKINVFSTALAVVYGFWPRWEPRPAENDIDRDLLDFCLWLAAQVPDIDPADVQRVAQHAGINVGSS